METFKRESILIAGGTGLIGSRIVQLIDMDKYEIRILSRSKRNQAGVKFYQWDLDHGQIDEKAFENLDYIVNLAGEGIADKNWSSERKQRIIESRTKSCELLAEYTERFAPELKAFIAASAIGIYGDRDDEILTNESTIGRDGFLVESCLAWEAAISNLNNKVNRLVTIRVGIVLSTLGGALKPILLGTKFGSAAYFGNGNQFFSWIHIDDIARVFIHAIENNKISGVINGVNPNSVTAKEFTKAMNKAKGGFSIVHPVPRFIVKSVLGERATLVLNSSRVVPKSLLDIGFKFLFSEAEPAIADLLQRKV